MLKSERYRRRAKVAAARANSELLQQPVQVVALVTRAGGVVAAVAQFFEDLARAFQFGLVGNFHAGRVDRVAAGAVLARRGPAERIHRVALAGAAVPAGLPLLLAALHAEALLQQVALLLLHALLVVHHLLGLAALLAHLRLDTGLQVL